MQRILRTVLRGGYGIPKIARLIAEFSRTVWVLDVEIDFGLKPCWKDLVGKMSYIHINILSNARAIDSPSL